MLPPVCCLLSITIGGGASHPGPSRRVTAVDVAVRATHKPAAPQQAHSLVAPACCQQLIEKLFEHLVSIMEVSAAEAPILSPLVPNVLIPVSAVVAIIFGLWLWKRVSAIQLTGGEDQAGYSGGSRVPLPCVIVECL